MQLHTSLPHTLSRSLNRWYVISAFLVITTLCLMTLIQLFTLRELQKLTEQIEERPPALPRAVPQKTSAHIQRVQEQQQKLFTILEACCSATPEGVQLTQLLLEPALHIIAKGYARTTDAVTIFLQQLHERGYGHTELIEVTPPLKVDEPFSFHIQIKLDPPSTQEQAVLHGDHQTVTS